jgi:hypothetical protein
VVMTAATDSNSTGPALHPYAGERAGFFVGKSCRIN